MLIEQIIKYELRGPGFPGTTCISITSYFHDETKISKENIQVYYYLLPKLKEEMYFTSLYWAKPLTKFNTKIQDLKFCFGLKSQVKGGLNNRIF